MSVSAELTYTLRGENKTHKGQCKNLSHSGIQFETEKDLEEGTSLEIIIDTKSDKFKPMNAIVEIIRVESLENRGYKVSGKIVDYNEQSS
jgi:hypothetical protein